MLKVFTYRLNGIEETEVVHKILEAALPGTNAEYYNMPQFSPDHVLEDGDIAITFGRSAELVVSASEKAIQHVALPAPKNLVNREGNAEARDVAWNQLKDLAKKISHESFSPANVTLTEEDLPDLDRRHILMLQKLTEKANSRFCLQTAKNGKTIAVGYNIPTDVEADIKITFEELYTVRNVMDILEVNKVDLVGLE